MANFSRIYSFALHGAKSMNIQYLCPYGSTCEKGARPAFSD